MIIGPLGFDAWQARIREPDRETTVSRHALRDLLDRLDEILSGNTEGLSSPLGALQPPRVSRKTAVPRACTASKLIAWPLTWGS